MTFACAFLALFFELLLGYPKWLNAAIGHPVMWIGALIGKADRAWNLERYDPRRRRFMGALALTILLLSSLAAGAGLQAAAFALSQGVPVVGLVLSALIASTLLAQRSLHAHVAAVAGALQSGGLGTGRLAVAKIVGRDVEALDEAGVARAAIESLAENFSDAIVAPAFWLLVGGLPAGLAYKAVNTADSMIGHRSRRHRQFGWAAARCDDLVNLPASRLSAALLVLAAALNPPASARRALQTVRRDAGGHRSPNAGWPEAAIAGALALSLAGPRFYDGRLVDDAEMGRGGRREAAAADIRAALRLYWIADALLIALAGLMVALQYLLL